MSAATAMTSSRTRMLVQDFIVSLISSHMKQDNFLSCDVEALFDADAVGVLKNIIGCMYCGIAIAKSGDDGFVVWNESAKEILGKPAADISFPEWSKHYGVYRTEATDEQLVPAEELPLVRALAGEDVENYELFIRNENQPGAWISVNATPILRSQEVIGGIAVFKDISKEKKLERNVVELMAQLDWLKAGQQKLLDSLSAPTYFERQEM